MKLLGNFLNNLCMKFLGDLACSCGLMFDRVISTIALGHYSVRFGYQREQNYTEIVLKHVF